MHIDDICHINCKAHHRAPPAPANGRDATLQEITSVSTSIWCAKCNLPGTSIHEVSPDAPMYIFIDSFCPFLASMCTYLIHNPWRCVAWNHEFSGWKGKHQLSRREVLWWNPQYDTRKVMEFGPSTCLCLSSTRDLNLKKQKTGWQKNNKKNRINMPYSSKWAHDDQWRTSDAIIYISMVRSILIADPWSSCHLMSIHAK